MLCDTRVPCVTIAMCNKTLEVLDAAHDTGGILPSHDHMKCFDHAYCSYRALLENLVLTVI